MKSRYFAFALDFLLPTFPHIRNLVWHGLFFPLCPSSQRIDTVQFVALGERLDPKTYGPKK